MSKKRQIVLLCLVVCLALSAAIALSACKEDTTYSVTYEKGNSAATGEAPETIKYKVGDEVTVADNTFTLDGYDFTGWSDGSKTYQKGEKFTMPEKDVTLTAQWKLKSSGDDDNPPDDDEPTLAELNSKVYDAKQWEYMTNNNGATNDGGDVVYGLDDGSVKFHRVNQAIDLGEKLTKASFMIKSTHDFKLWFNSSSKDNATNNSYRLAYEYGQLRLVVSTAGDKAAAVVTSSFELGKWNRIDIEFAETVNAETERTVCAIKLYVNGKRATLAAGENTMQITVANNTLTHTQVGSFETGTWLVAKVWDACDFFQIKPVAKADEKDVPIIAAIGASITEGAGAGNFYTESYPAQLQKELGGAYNVINFGKSGRTVRTDLPSAENEDPTPWLENKQWGGVQAIKPDIAIINMGTNDSKTSNVPATTTENFTAAYNHLLDELLAVNEDMRIIICTVPYAYSGIYDINNDNIANIIAPVQRAIAAEREMELVDLYQITQNKSLLFGDGVHPGTRGYAMFVEVLSAVIENGAEALTEEFLADIDERYNDPEFSIENIHATINATDEQITLTVTGKIEMEDTSYLRLVADVSDGQERYEAITLNEDGTFSVSMRIDDLTSNEWYIIRIYLTESYGEIVMLNQTDYAVNDEFTSATRKVIVKSWSDRFNLKLEDYDNSYSITATSITFDEQYLVVTGTATGNVQSLVLALHNDNNLQDNIRVNATVSEGAFEARLDLTEITLGAGSWLYLWYSVNGGNDTKVIYAKDNTTHIYENRQYRFEYWEGIAIAYSPYVVSANSATLTSVTVIETEGKINLTIVGTTNDNGIRLYVGDNPTKDDVYNHYEPITVGDDGAFTVTFDLATCPIGGWYNIRLYYSDGEYYAVSYEEAVNAKGQTLAVENMFYGTNTSVTVKSWNDKGGTVKTFSIEVKAYDSSYTLTPTSIAFDNGYFVLTGTASNVRNLYVYLINTNVAGSLDNYVEAEIDGSSFTARLPLATLVSYSKTATPFNLRYKVNDLSKATENVAPAEMDMTQVAWSDLKIFYLGTNNGCVAVYYTTDYAYGLTEAAIQNIDDKATLVLAGTLQDNTKLPETIYLLLDETANNTGKQKILAENKATTAGTFRFEVDVTALEASEEASSTNGAASRHYYIRLYTGTNLTADNYTSGTKLADVNSRWLADKLFKAINVVGDSSDYYFIRNTTNDTYNTLGIIRVGKDASAIKLGDIDDITLGYYSRDSKTIDLSQYVDANGTTVTYTVSSTDTSLATAAVADGILTVTATGLSGTAKITVSVLSNGEQAFDLEFDVTLDDSTITKTHNYQSFLSADSWLDIVGDGNDRPRYDSWTNSVLLQWGNIYQQIGAATHISFDLWVNPNGDYGFEIWFRSTTNNKDVTGNRYVMNGYDTWNNNIIYIADETGSWLATFPKFPAGQFTRFDITMLDVYVGDTVVKTLINIYINGQKVNLTGDSVTNGTIVDESPIAADEGVYFALKSWAPQVAIRTASEIANPDAIKVAAVGDSITYGHSWHNESYPTYLATELGSDYNVGNYGLNGASVTGFGGSSLKYADQTQYTDSVAFDADIIVIMLGANDANDWANASATYESDLRALISAYKAACPNATILLVTSAPTLESNSFGIPNDTIKNDVNPIQRSVAQDLGLTLVDLRAAMEAAEGGYNGFFREDGVHLSVEGAQFVATVIGNAIKALG